MHSSAHRHKDSMFVYLKQKRMKKRKEKRKSALVKRKETEKKTKPALLCS